MRKHKELIEIAQKCKNENLTVHGTNGTQGSMNKGSQDSPPQYLI